MTAKEFIELLTDFSKHGLNLDDELKTFDPDTMNWESVTGMTYGGNDGVIKLYTDDDNSEMEQDIKPEKEQKERKNYAGHTDRSVHPTDAGTSG